MNEKVLCPYCGAEMYMDGWRTGLETKSNFMYCTICKSRSPEIEYNQNERNRRKYEEIALKAALKRHNESGENNG